MGQQRRAGRTRIQRWRSAQKRIAERLKAAQQHRCFYCGRDNDGWTWTRDHVFPRSLGFQLATNMVMSCEECNQTKGSRLPTRSELDRAVAVYEAAGLTDGARVFRGFRLVVSDKKEGESDE